MIKVAKIEQTSIVFQGIMSDVEHKIFKGMFEMFFPKAQILRTVYYPCVSQKYEALYGIDIVNLCYIYSIIDKATKQETFVMDNIDGVETLLKLNEGKYNYYRDKAIQIKDKNFMENIRKVEDIKGVNDKCLVENNIIATTFLWVLLNEYIRKSKLPYEINLNRSTECFHPTMTISIEERVA